MRGITIRAGIAAALAALAVASTAEAATLKVTETGDPVPGACTSNDCTLREAVRRANASAAADKIVLRARNYGLQQVGFDDDATAGDLDVAAGSGRLTIAGKGPGKTTIDGNDVERVLQVLEGGRLVLSKLTVTDGGTSGGGAGLFNEGSATLQNVAIRGNFAGSIGGGLWNSGDGRLTISRSRISGNEGDSGGGGIWSEDTGAVTITRSRITGNRTASNGGGVLNQNESRMRISRSRINGNSAEGRGGGVYNNNEARLAIARSTIAGNHADDDGGGLFLQNETQTRIKGSTISKNTVLDDGGGAFIQNDALVVVVNSTVSGNRAAEGGAIYGNNWPYITINFSTIAKNSAESTGGAIFAQTSGVNLLRPPPFWLLRGTIVAKNSSPGADNCALHEDSDASHFGSRGSNLEDDNSCFFTRGSDQRNANAKLRRLAKNGGTTKTHALKPSSDAVDAAKRKGCPGRDQRRVKRPQGNRCDIGSYELKQR